MRWRLVVIQAVLSLLLVWLVVSRQGGSLEKSLADPLLLFFLFFSILFSSWFASRLGKEWIGEINREFRTYGAKAFEEQGSLDEQAFKTADELRQTLQTMVDKYHHRVAHLSTEKSRLKVILESISEAILVTGQDGRAQLANRALSQLFNVGDEMLGRPTAEIVRHAAVQGAIDDCLQNGVEKAIEVEMGVGSVRYLDVHVAPILREEQFVGAVTVFYDITRLRQLERMRRDFVANVSHELRTPLTSIKGYAETLADGALNDKEAAARFVSIISTNADRLSLLLDDLLDLSRLESEQFRIEKKQCDLRRLIESSISSVRTTAESKRVALQLEMEGEHSILCDAQHMENALTNLLDNAVKYTPESGRVDVGLRFEDERVWVNVSDTGIGIPSADLDRIFERFYRVDKGRSRAMGGTGLGLAIVRHVVEAHGEKVLVESEVGRGTTFRISLSNS